MQHFVALQFYLALAAGMAPARKRKAAIAAAIAIKREPGVEVKQELAAEQKPAVRIKTEEIKNTNRQLEGDTKREAGHTKQNGAGSAAPRARDSAVKAEAAVKIKDWTTTAAASIKQDKFNSAQSPARRHKQPQPLGPFPDMMRPLEEECLVCAFLARNVFPPINAQFARAK